MGGGSQNEGGLVCAGVVCAGVVCAGVALWELCWALLVLMAPVGLWCIATRGAGRLLRSPRTPDLLAAAV